MKVCILEINFEGLGWSLTVCLFTILINASLRVNIIFRKEMKLENGGLIFKYYISRSRQKNGVLCLVSMLPS